MNKSKVILSWILRILVAIGFLAASLGKLSNNPQVITMFDQWGFPDGFHFVIGALEFIFAVLVLMPKTLKVALIGLFVLMIGALFTHILNDPIQEVLRPLVFMILLGIIFLLNFQPKKIGSFTNE